MLPRSEVIAISLNYEANLQNGVGRRPYMTPEITIRVTTMLRTINMHVAKYVQRTTAVLKRKRKIKRKEEAEVIRQDA